MPFAFSTEMEKVYPCQYERATCIEQIEWSSFSLYFLFLSKLHTFLF